MNWKAIKHSAIGTSHAKFGKDCQDAAYFEIHPYGLIAAVSDGAGSATHSDLGSRIATQVACGHLKKWLCFKTPKLDVPSVEMARDLFEAVLEEIEIELTVKADSLGVPVRELSCTLIACVATSRWICAMQVGDGLFVYRSEKEIEYSLMFKPVKGEYINETDFVTSKNAIDSLQVQSFEWDPGFICMATDGIEKVSVRMSDWSPHAPFFKPFDDYIQPGGTTAGESNFLEEFLNSERLNAKTDDDKTMLIAAPRSYETIENFPI